LPTIRLRPNDDVDEVEPEVSAAGENEFDAAPVNERCNKPAVEDIEGRARHPGTVERCEFLTVHFSGRHRKFPVMRLRRHVADVGHVVGLVGQHEAGLLARQHQAFVALGIAGVGLQNAVAAEDPEVSRPRHGFVRRSESEIDFPNAVVRLVIQQQEIDFRFLKPRHDDVLAKIDQLGEFDPQRLFVPLSRFTQTVQRD
jgi:hypothetical protein